MLASFLGLSMSAGPRQRAFRFACTLQLALIGTFSIIVSARDSLLPALGQVALIAGIVAGAMLIGWRLTQLPKSQVLEFMLVSPLQPTRLFLMEAMVGMMRLGLVVASTIPIYCWLAVVGCIEWIDMPVLVLVPWLWGSVTGLALTAFAYESVRIRRCCEIVGIIGILLYLVIGVMAGEKLYLWLKWLPDTAQWWVMELYIVFHQWNPFAVQQYWFETIRDPQTAILRMMTVQTLAAITIVVLMARAACRLKGHFHDRHYRPLSEVTPADVSDIRDRPLSWWAVRRVMEYSGRLNLYLAGGFGVAYSIYLLFADRWPPWLGNTVFQIVERAGGVPMVTTGLVLLAAVPAAFQYGLWDSSVQDRLRRLELLLLTDVDGRDYWNAAAAAAWRRGRGYLAIALLLWVAAWWAGRLNASQVATAITAAVILWAGYFALGFRAFARGHQASGLGSFLTLGLPTITFLLVRYDWAGIAAWTPPGMICLPLMQAVHPVWLLAPIVVACAVLWSARHSMICCDNDLRTWYERHHGMKMADQ